MDISITQPKLKILRQLEKSPSHGYDLANTLDLHGSTVYEHLHDLEDAGYTESEEDGRRIVYTLTEKGELILEAESMDD